jgi:hypothetical protein
MRSRIGIGIAVLAVLAMVAGPGSAGEDKPWFDMANCSMCKDMMSHPEIMPKMSWKNYPMNTGVMSVCTVTDDARETYLSVCNAMEATGEKLMAGEEMPLCGSCDAYMALLGKGVKTEMVVTDFGSVRLSLSDDKEVVSELHSWAQHNDEEMAKMAAMMKKPSE